MGKSSSPTMFTTQTLILRFPVKKYILISEVLQILITPVYHLSAGRISNKLRGSTFRKKYRLSLNVTGTVQVNEDCNIFCNIYKQ